MIDVEPLIAESFDRIFPQPVVEENWQEVLRRVGVRGRRSRRRVLALVAAGLVVAAASTAFAYHYLGPSPGFTAGLSALDTAPAASWPSSLPRISLDGAAKATGLTPGQAAQRLHLLQTGLSLGQEHAGDVSLYGFEGNSGTGCLFLTGPASGAICLPSDMTGNPAFDGLAFGDQGGNSPQPPGLLAIYGLAADNVRQVETDVSGTTHTVPIVNNSFYADYPGITSTDTISLIVHFDEGTTRTFHLPNPYASSGPTQTLPYTPTQIPNP